jgi:hypothetical protein
LELLFRPSLSNLISFLSCEYLVVFLHETFNSDMLFEDNYQPFA